MNLVLRLWHYVWRGISIAIAELVPGVSGGTLALLTGVYPLLLRGIALVGSLRWWRVLVTSPRRGLREITAPSLVALGCGMVAGLWFLSPVIHWLWYQWPGHLKVFFIGIVCVGVTSFLMRGKQPWLVLPGFLVALVVGLSVPQIWPLGAVGLLLAGLVSASAWVLPGLSGSLILVLIGYYEIVLGALGTRDWSVLLPFIAGVIPGALIIGGLLHRVWQRRAAQLQSLLAGLMLGSVVQLLPEQLQWGLGLPLLFGVVCGLALVR